MNLAVLGSYGADGEIDRKLLQENINKIDGIYKLVSEEEVAKESFKIIVDGYEFTIQKNGKVEGDKELATPEELPKNEEGIGAGEEVQLEEGWEGKTQAETTVYAVSDGEKNTIPIPKGFYYVGGTEETGVVISDSLSDKDKGKGQTDVTKNLVGNQFVWIPCKEENYQKYNWGNKYKNNTWDDTTPEEEKAKIAKYGGFYVARYEAGTSEVTLTNGKKIGDEQLSTGSKKYILSETTTSSKPTSKANEIPYYLADYETAQEMSKRMYNNSDYVSSGLITGTQWDVMLNYISDETDKSVGNASNDEKYTDLKANCKWGNYKDTNLTNCDGKYCTVDGTTFLMKSLWLDNTEKSNKHEEKDAILLTTGSTDGNVKESIQGVKKKNVYDVAGNLWEWTQEKANITASGSNYSLRGGGYFHQSSHTACFRHWEKTETTSISCGFRVSLYIK